MGKRLALEAELAVDVVFEDDEVAAFRQFEQLFAPLQGHAHAGGQLEGRDGVDHLGADSVPFEAVEAGLDLLHHHAVVVDGNAEDGAARRFHVAQGVGEGGGLGDDAVAGTDEAAGRQRDGLHRAGGEQDAFPAQVPPVAGQDAGGDLVAELGVAVDELVVIRVSVLKGLRAVARDHLGADAGELVGGEGLLGGDAGVEVVDDGPAGVLWLAAGVGRPLASGLGEEGGDVDGHQRTSAAALATARPKAAIPRSISSSWTWL